MNTNKIQVLPCSCSFVAINSEAAFLSAALAGEDIPRTVSTNKHE